MAKHGTPGWSKYRPDSVTFPVEDLAELAVRLGSIVSFDRRGDVLWMDGFEDGILKWEGVPGGSGAAMASDSTRAHNGGYSAKLTTGSSDPYSAEIKHFEAYPHLSKIGIEVTSTIHASLSAFYLDLRIFTGSQIVEGQVAYDPGADVLYYMDSDGNLQTLAEDVDLKENTRLFHRFKLVVDAENEVYARLIVDATEYDLSAHPLHTAADTTSPYMLARIIAAGDSGGNYSIYVDDVIVTQDEP